MPAPSTKDRIITAAQELFGEQGYPATSLREITARADVNLAAVNYHFGSKENLLHEIVRHCLKPLNEERMRGLDQLEIASRESGTPLALRDVIHAFLEPAVRLFSSTIKEALPCMMARLHHELTPGLEDLMNQIISPVVARFVASVQLTLPEHKPKEIILRGHFMMGSLLHLMDTSPDFMYKLSGGLVDLNDSEYLLDQLVDFCTAGFRNA
ncbi:MAG: TetR/AcrR family transcriptional regulator [Planctomycetota bacterium]|nr:TetR/AcrR family transcriptional regulator [Planctomycetota bacterium]MDA1113826.1 TetR/AcrR family transcriptional regulator [Planctomycetota bacterium]